MRGVPAAGVGLEAIPIAIVITMGIPMERGRKRSNAMASGTVEGRFYANTIESDKEATLEALPGSLPKKRLNYWDG